MGTETGVARLHEYQGKDLLRQYGIAVPEGEVVTTAEQARRAAVRLGGRVVLKVQAWTTGRAAKGGVRFAESPAQAEDAAQAMLAMKFGNFPVTHLLVERAIKIKDELFVSLTIDDAARSPVLLLDLQGGSGIEERAASVTRVRVDVHGNVDRAAILAPLVRSNVEAEAHDEIVQAIETVARLARECDARSLEINPLVTTADGVPARVVAADCRMTIDDYAVYRQPKLGIEIARELDHPPTTLERIAYQIEEADHRGTFYFAQLPTDSAAQTRGVIGFHGAGGGGSMMSMDAVTNAGFTLANFCDTSGNPSAAKVYRAARVILAQPEIIGYFGSGSGVASQEQFWSAYGLAKAFTEMQLTIPAVIRLGGNSEDRAVEILESVGHSVDAPVEGYRKDDTPALCAERFRELVEEAPRDPKRMVRRVPDFVGATNAYSVPINNGTLWIDYDACDRATSALVVKHSSNLFKLDDDDKPVLAVSAQEIMTKDSELIACEIECLRAGRPVVFVDLPIPGLDHVAS
jgi:succinyl-CoA synthetase beta subunit